jgi:hypothetical protein
LQEGPRFEAGTGRLLKNSGPPVFEETLVMPTSRIRSDTIKCARLVVRVGLVSLAVAFFVAGCTQPQQEPVAQNTGAVAAEKPADEARVVEPVAKKEPQQQALQRRQELKLKQQTSQTPRREPQPAVASTGKKPADKKGGCCGSKGAANLPPLTPDPTQTGTPQYVCAKPIVRAEPVWIGKPVTFDFEIANRGTADLLIKLKGG